MSNIPVAPPPPSPGWSVTPGPPAVLRSPVGLSKAVMLLLGLVIVADLFALWQGGQSYELVGRIVGDLGSVSSEEIDRADTLYGASGYVQLVAILATAVVFIVWFHRARVNAEVFAPEYHTKKRGWAIWGWIVPVVNLWFPRRIATDIWNASADESSRSRALLNWWWALWVVDLLFGRLASQRYIKAETPEEIKGALSGLMASDVFNIAAAVLAILFVRRLTHMQHEKALRGPTV
ncbi:DUF4328 domain-containing protein [Streptomyces piniterrae]|uniref:DUF4328 domain-containing protein n=1 Tax=Streptomyces piniterrae TaxID=2571125 RepID=A0A4U0NVV8_9ACTN|nr:DUF4328 domain-containing protein [Streptomyces piniterrae]TJZ54374.1 DUF4328 domain-containing protein [Streptomyces piniterrae]